MNIACVHHGELADTSIPMPRPRRRIPSTGWTGQIFIDDLYDLQSMIIVFQGRQIPDLNDLHDLYTVDHVG